MATVAAPHPPLTPHEAPAEIPPDDAPSGVSLTIAEAAAVSGLSAHTLRYYERDGLMLDAVERAPSGHRRYTDADLRWLHMITCLRGTGMPIRDVARYAALVRSGEGNEAERLALLHAHREHVEEQIATLTQHLSRIDRKVALYEERLASASAGAGG